MNRRTFFVALPLLPAALVALKSRPVEVLRIHATDTATHVSGTWTLAGIGEEARVIEAGEEQTAFPPGTRLKFCGEVPPGWSVRPPDA